MPPESHMPLPLSLYNTLTRRTEPFEPGDPDAVKFYVCGPTVYDEAHLGHARTYITWDILVRFLEFSGYSVLYTRNVTDVDDKIINRAQGRGQSPESLSRFYTERFHAVMARLNVKSPWQEPKATENIPEMVTFIQKLLDTGYAYQGAGGTVYYRTAQKSDYGNLCHQNLEQLQSGARVEVNPEKESPLDFALWKPADRSEPLVWEAPWGWGRPGWHIECSAMSHKLLGDQLDLHAGGMDLIFPHHQNEIAQSEAFTGQAPFVRYWLHNGFVNISGEKMSKSLDNFLTIDNLLQVYDANAIRYFLMIHHYRSPVDFNAAALEGATNRIRKIQAQFQRHQAHTASSTGSTGSGGLNNILRLREWLADSVDPTSFERIILGWAEAMQNDLNTAQALRYWDELAEIALNTSAPEDSDPAAGSSLELTAFEAFIEISAVMGFDFSATQRESVLVNIHPQLFQLYETVCGELQIQAELDAQLADPEAVIQGIISCRAQARAEKNWGVSDMIRDRMGQLGIKFEDHKDKSTTWLYEPAKTASPS